MWKSVPNFVEICVIKMPQRDLKGRMPEQSEWLLALGIQPFRLDTPAAVIKTPIITNMALITPPKQQNNL